MIKTLGTMLAGAALALGLQAAAQPSKLPPEPRVPICERMLFRIDDNLIAIREQMNIHDLDVDLKLTNIEDALKPGLLHR